MKHPNTEEWISFLYAEADPATHRTMAAHLKSCPACAGTVGNLRRTMNALDTWRLEPETKPVSAARFPNAWRWAAAAMILIGIGYGIGRSAPGQNVDLVTLQARLVPELREQLRAEFRRDLTAALVPNSEDATDPFQTELRQTFLEWASGQNAAARNDAEQLVGALADAVRIGRNEDRQATLELVGKLDQQQQAAYGRLWRNLETVAVVADGRFQQTEDQLGRLISYTEPGLR